MSEAYSDQGAIDLTFEASGDLSTKQYFAVKLDSNGQIAVAGAGEKAIGILQNKPAAAGRAGTVRVFGVSRMYAGGVIAPGANVAADAAGEGKTAVANTTDTQAGAAADPLLGSYVLGISLNVTNTADGDIFPVFINHLGAVPGTVS